MACAGRAPRVASGGTPPDGRRPSSEPRRTMRRVLSVAVGAALLAAVPATASAAPPENAPDNAPARVDDLSSPLSDKQRDLRAAAVQKVVAGEVTPAGDNKGGRGPNGQYGEVAQEDSDAIWTVLGEFSDLGHNRIPRPDRS